MTEQDAKREYAKGYAAGRKRMHREYSRALADHRKEEFRKQAFLAALGTCIDVQGWTRGKEPITSLKARTDLAMDFADEAVKRFSFSGFVIEQEFTPLANTQAKEG